MKRGFEFLGEEAASADGDRIVDVKYYVALTYYDHNQFKEAMERIGLEGTRLVAHRHGEDAAQEERVLDGVTGPEDALAVALCHLQHRTLQARIS